MSKIMGLMLTVLFLIFPKELKAGISNGLNNTFSLLIPSVFPYIIISSLFLNTGALNIVSEITYKFIKKLTGISKNASGAYLLSLFCGYPTGAKLSSSLYNEKSISKYEMKKLFYFASVPGFGFCVSFLGLLYNDGIKIYLSYILASVTINFILKNKGKKEYLFEKKEDISYNFSESLVESIRSSSKTMLEITGYVCFFSSLCEIIKKTEIITNNSLLSALLCGFLEITTGNAEIYNLINVYPYIKYIAVFLTGFGGMCVLFQSMSFDRKNNISILHFMLSRFIFSLFSLIFFIIFQFLGGTK